MTGIKGKPIPKYLSVKNALWNIIEKKCILVLSNEIAKLNGSTYCLNCLFNDGFSINKFDLSKLVIFILQRMENDKIKNTIKGFRKPEISFKGS